MSTYTLQTPATNQDINQLIVRISETEQPGSRVTLNFGTCRLMCQDEAERREFGSSVTMEEAVVVLFNSKSPENV